MVIGADIYIFFGGKWMGDIPTKGVELFSGIQAHSVLEEVELCRDFCAHLISLDHHLSFR